MSASFIRRVVVNVGDTVDVRIVRIEPDRRRLGLSLRQAQEGSGEDGASEGQEETATTADESPQESPQEVVTEIA